MTTTMSATRTILRTTNLKVSLVSLAFVFAVAAIAGSAAVAAAAAAPITVDGEPDLTCPTVAAVERALDRLASPGAASSPPASTPPRGYTLSLRRGGDGFRIDLRDPVGRTVVLSRAWDASATDCEANAAAIAIIVERYFRDRTAAPDADGHATASDATASDATASDAKAGDASSARASACPRSSCCVATCCAKVSATGQARWAPTRAPPRPTTRAPPIPRRTGRPCASSGSDAARRRASRMPAICRVRTRRGPPRPRVGSMRSNDNVNI
jgi:hypothetical protein